MTATTTTPETTFPTKGLPFITVGWRDIGEIQFAGTGRVAILAWDLIPADHPLRAGMTRDECFQFTDGLTSRTAPVLILGGATRVGYDREKNCDIWSTGETLSVEDVRRETLKRSNPQREKFDWETKRRENTRKEAETAYLNSLPPAARKILVLEQQVASLAARVEALEKGASK